MNVAALVAAVLMPPMGGVQLSQADLAAVADYVWAIGHQNVH